MSNQEHRFNVTVYYSDTDAGGVVYYPNYVTFMENARQEMMREAGFMFPAFVYVHSDIQIKSPAKLGDLLTVVTEVTNVGASKLEVSQKIFRDPAKTALVTMKSTLAYVNPDIRACRIPEDLRTALRGLCSSNAQKDD
jgi:acyl-CoA thioester hydrolase